MASFALVTANAQTVTQEHQTTTQVQSGKPSHAERKAHERTIKSQAKEQIVQDRHAPNMRVNRTDTHFTKYSVSDFQIRHRPRFNIVMHDRAWYVNNGYQIVLIGGCPYFYDLEVNGYVPAFGYYSECVYPDNYIIYYN